MRLENPLGRQPQQESEPLDAGKRDKKRSPLASPLLRRPVLVASFTALIASGGGVANADSPTSTPTGETSTVQMVNAGDSPTSKSVDYSSHHHKHHHKHQHHHNNPDNNASSSASQPTETTPATPTPSPEATPTPTSTPTPTDITPSFTSPVETTAPARPTDTSPASPTPTASAHNGQLGACTTSGATGAGNPTKVVQVPAPHGDMTSAIKQALASGHGEKVELQAGTYIISSSISIPSDDDFTGAGMGATTLEASDTANVNPMITVPSSSSNVTVENMTVNQNGASKASKQSLQAYMVETRGTNTIFQDIATRMPSTYSMVAADADKFCFRNNNVLQDPAENGKYKQEDGIHILNSSNGDVIDNYVDNSYNGATDGDDGLVAHAYGGPVNNVRYESNIVRGGKNGTAIAIWDFDNNVSNLVITGNEIWGDGAIGHGDGYGGDSGKFTNSQITKNIIHNVGGDGISIAGSGLTVGENYLCQAGTVKVTGSGNKVSNNPTYATCENAPSTQTAPPLFPPK